MVISSLVGDTIADTIICVAAIAAFLFIRDYAFFKYIFKFINNLVDCCSNILPLSENILIHSHAYLVSNTESQ